MKKGLAVAMIVWAAIGIVYGLVFIIAPGQTLSTFGPGKWPAYAPYFLMLLGNSYIVSGVFVIIAARDPLKHILWLQLAIAWSLLDALGAFYFMIWGEVNFSQAELGLVIDIIFVVAFLALYPRRKTPAR